MGKHVVWQPRRHKPPVHRRGTVQKSIFIPTAVSSLRLAVLPLFIYLYSAGDVTLCLILLGFAAATDFFDGYIARKLEATSKFGAYYDAATDFTLMFGIFTFFMLLGLYPVWLPILIAISFAQFLITSHFSAKFYDPVGKYMGSALYIGVVLTVVFPSQETFTFVEYAFLGFFIVSLASRVVSLKRKAS